MDGILESAWMTTMPAAVRLREVGPRDGLQNEPEVIATADKVALVEALGRTGLRRLEVTSFVRPDVVPQLADAAEVLRTIDVPGEVAIGVLIPNERGLERALDAGGRFEDVSVFVSASETHNQRNVNRSIEGSMGEVGRGLGRAGRGGGGGGGGCS